MVSLPNAEVAFAMRETLLLVTMLPKYLKSSTALSCQAEAKLPHNLCRPSSESAASAQSSGNKRSISDGGDLIWYKGGCKRFKITEEKIHYGVQNPN